MDALRAWALLGGVDGFRFDLATTLGRRADGFDPHAPLLAAIAQDPLLRDLQADRRALGYRPGRLSDRALSRRLGRVERPVPRRVAQVLARRCRACSASSRRASPARPIFSHAPAARRAAINFVVAHDGFTLADLVSYERKHNEANGEDNRDGTDANYSWNNGAEGKPATIPRSWRRGGAISATCWRRCSLARGTPMLAMGAEFGHSQHGNNNAYAQDNATAWLDWDKADPRLIDFTRALIALRRQNRAFTQDRFLTGAPTDSGLPDVEWRDADGVILRDGQWQDGERRFLAAFFHTDGSRAAVLLNAGRDEAPFRLPQPRDNFSGPASSTRRPKTARQTAPISIAARP